MREGGGRRASRGGQGGQGRGGRRNNDRDRGENPNKLAISARGTPTPGPMSPPPRPSSATQTPTPTVEPPSPIVRPDPLPFDYTILTDERIASWDTNGRQQVVTLGSQMLEDEDTTDLSTIFQELIRAALDIRIDATDAGNCVKEILGPDTASIEQSTLPFDPQTLFLDTLSMMVDAEPGASDPKTFPKLLRTFASATGISPAIMRQKLDSALIQNLGLTRETFIRVGIRQATHLLYRQANYNLLREETEGYSKLVTELFTTSGSEPPSAEVVADTFERVKGLIGTFDLDVGRVLDITMDIFAAVLIKHFRFFIKLLRVSSWWPRNEETDATAAARCNGLPKWAFPDHFHWFTSEDDEERAQEQRAIRDIAFWERAREVGLDAFFELGGRDVVDAKTKKLLFGSKGEGDAELDAERQWIEATGTFPPSGNRIAAQLLGFKLRFYSSPARDKDDVLPANLIYLTALLIKIGFISLRDLYPHLWPFDEDMEKVKEVKLKELEEKERLNRPGGATNALMMAGALVDDTLPNGGRSRETATKADPVVKLSTDVEDKDKLDDPTDQKVQLLTCLLTIGAIPESLFILGQFPWLPEAYPDLLDLIHRILNHMIKDVYGMSRPTSTQDFGCQPKEVVDPDQGGVPKGDIRLSPSQTKKLLRWPFPDKYDTNEGNNYRFYWDEWADNVPVCQSVDDVFTLCRTFLNLSGVNIGKDSSLLSKLARIGVKSLSTDPSQQNLDRWQDLLKRLLVPALSLTKANTSIVNEIYDMLRFYPVSIRYSIYAEWFEGQISRLPAMKASFARTRLETLSIMKRISMTNLTAMARTLAKSAYASPGIVFNVALGQIEAYTNLTEVVVECAKYFTDLGYDVLVWSLASSLGGKERNRNNAEFALLPSRWLLALSRFSGKVFRRYSIMNPSPIIQYVNDQLYRGNSTDLVIFKELIAQMAGVVPDTDFTDSQLSAMTGGPLLRKHTLINLQDKRYESTKTAKRLMRALTETKLAGQLLLSMAQHRYSAIYTISDDDAHIKMLATMVDDAQLILSQYLDLLRSNLSVEEFDNHVPSIPELLTDFGLDAALAFMLGRASLSYRIEKISSPVINGSIQGLIVATEPSPVQIDAEGDIGMEEGSGTEVAGDQKHDATSIATNGDIVFKDDVQMTELQEPSPSLVAESDTLNNSSDLLDEMIQPIIETVQKVQPEDSWKAITPQFYVTFWTATLSDILIPGKSYDSEISRVKQDLEALQKDLARLTAGTPQHQEKVKKTEAARQLFDALVEEYKKEIGAFRQRKMRLLKRKSQWFTDSVKPDIISDAILEKCIIPRVLLSPTDADFCFRMIKILHDNGTPNFRTLSLYGRIFKHNRLRSIIFSCTVREAENFGRFLKSILADLGKWHADATLYEKEALGSSKALPGFTLRLPNEDKPKGLEHDGKDSPTFKSILLIWHKALNSALRDCLEGTEWMHIRNAITILKTLVDVFPVVNFMGSGFIKQLETIATREKDAREDLALTGNAVLVQLKKKSTSWIIVQAFSSSATGQGQTNGALAKATPPPASTAAPKSNLKPTAPEFRPQSRASSIGVSTPKPTTTEVEDGEVDDSKVVTAAAKPDPPTTNAADTKLPTSPSPATIEPRKSEVLLKREQHLRERDAKNASVHAAANAPGRPELLRNVSSSALDRNNSSLPSRPDAPFPSHRIPERHPSSRHGDRRDGRDSRLPDSNRLDRPGDRPRDFPGHERRDAEPPRDFSRPPERGMDRPRARPDPPPRWTPESARENQERALNGSRLSESSGRLTRENMPPPRLSGASSERVPLGERLPPINPERQELINPERAALMTGTKTPPRSDSPRRPRDEPRNSRDRTISRPESPRRHGSERDVDTRREERSSRNGPVDVHTSSHTRPEEVPPPPAGPRSDRPMDRNNERGPMDRSRGASAFQPTPAPPRSMDPDHGRLNTSVRPQVDPNFGRLNPSPITDIPSGPRDRNQRSNRMASGPRHDGRLSGETPRPPTPERSVPTGPSSNRQPRRSASGQFDSVPNTPSSVPTTPFSAVAAPPIHPDRLRHIGPSAQPPPLPSANNPSGSHHDQSSRVDSGPAAPSGLSNSNQTRPPIPPIVTAGPPSGPKGTQSSPISSGPNGLTAPTGPASAVERSRGGRRQLAGINTMLQQAGQQNVPDRMNVRGRGRMSSTAQAEPNFSAPTTPTVPPPPPPPGPPPSASRGDGINPDRADLITGPAPMEERDRDRNGRRERSGRHSRRASRSPTGGDRSKDDRGGSGREHRERRDGRIEQDRHQGAIPRDPNGSSRDSGRDRERDRGERDTRRDGGRDRDGQRELHESGWAGSERGDRGGGERGGRSRDMRSDEQRRESRGTRSDEGGRKRRSDEGGMERGHEKRPRR